MLIAVQSSVMIMKWAIFITWMLSLLAADLGLASGKEESWDVGGLKREAWVYVPEKKSNEPVPVVFVFHGHGGKAERAKGQFKIHELWPEALVVYPQGVNTPGALTDPKGKRSGWQSKAGDHGDRDLLFFDAMLSDLSKRYSVDAKRVYATGHSNGGGFSYLLWAERGDRLAAIGPSAAVSRNILNANPLPVVKISGQNDRLVKYDWQKATLAIVKRINGAEGDGLPWGKGVKGATHYKSEKGADVLSVIHQKGHRLDQDSIPLIVEFFKKQVRK